MTSFTKGQWRISPWDATVVLHPEFKDENGYRKYISVGSNATIAFNEACANSRLISAAPDMFDLLLLIGDTIASEHPGDWTDQTIKGFEDAIKLVTEKAAGGVA